MNHNELDMLLMKLTKIQKDLGGSTDPLIRDQNQDEFNNIKYKLVETVNEVSKKQEERDENFNKNGRTMAVIKFGIDIQDGFQDLDAQLKQMKEALRRQKKNPKKFPPEEIEIREGQYEKYQDLVHQLKAREDGDTTVEKEKPITLTELKINLGGARKAQPVDVGRQLNDIEQEAINQFKKVDKEMDIMIDQVNVGLDNLKNKAEIMGDALEQQEEAIASLEKEVDKANEQLMTSNAKLKKVLYTYKKPGSFCMNIICILVLLGLIGVIIKLATGL